MKFLIVIILTKMCKHGCLPHRRLISLLTKEEDIVTGFLPGFFPVPPGKCRNSTLNSPSLTEDNHGLKRAPKFFGNSLRALPTIS
jgi:hypothetical protein